MALASIADIRRRELIQAAFEVIKREGLQFATVAKMEREAGASKGTLHKYFKNKEELALSSIRNAFECPPTGFSEEAQPLSDPVRAIMGEHRSPSPSQIPGTGILPGLGLDHCRRHREETVRANCQGSLCARSLKPSSFPPYAAASNRMSPTPPWHCSSSSMDADTDQASWPGNTSARQEAQESSPLSQAQCASFRAIRWQSRK